MIGFILSYNEQVVLLRRAGPSSAKPESQAEL